MDWTEKLRGVLANQRGVRLGEAAVVSRQVHTLDPRRPGEINVLPHADAGAVFYGRRAPGEIVHVDVFHAVGRADHRAVAAAVAVVLAERPARGAPGPLADYADIQTGTGGGRVSGDLSFGQRPSLLASHLNHVHLALLLGAADLALLLPLVAAVEGELRRQGLAPRRIEQLRHPPPGGAPLDLSPYMSDSDSRLQDAGGSSGRGSSGEATGGGAAGEARLQQALALARRIGSPDEVAQLLDTAEQGALPSSGPAAVLARQLEQEGLLRRTGRSLELSELGQELRQFLNANLREVRLHFRKLLRRVPGAPGTARWQRPAPPSAAARWGRVAGSAPAPPGAWFGALAVPDTVRAAVRRAWLARAAAGACARAGPGDSPWCLRRSDVHVELRAGTAPLSICLLIDASASMAGRRLLAAKHLARHLVLSTRDRVSIIAFQERSVCIQAPFTRDYGLIEAGLARIQPQGLTPLALGLSAGLELVRGERVRRPLLLLITDGIPTVPSLTLDPLADALEAARQVQRARMPLGVIGLQPSRRYLSELAKAAGGSLHVVDELDAEALVAFAHRERRRRLHPS